MVFRLDPALPVHAYKTYQIVSPISTHFRPGSCDEAGCLAYRKGWVTRVDESSDLGRKQAHYIRRVAGRKFTEEREPTGLTAFTFEAGQKCFATHQIPLERPELYVVRDGDWRGNPTGWRMRHTSADAWVNDHAEHQDRIARVING